MDSMKRFECQRVQRELEPDSRATVLGDDVALHFDQCPSCRKLFDANRLEFDPSEFERLDAQRRRTIVTALAGARTAEGRRGLALGAVAAAAIIGIAVAAMIGLGLRSDARADEVVSAFVEDHIRYLNSQDRRSGGGAAAAEAALGPYVDFPLRIPKLSQARLTGSRRCYILDRRVALLFYESPSGAISYFALEGDGLSPPGRPCEARSNLTCSSFKGYRVASWEKAGLIHAVVGPESRFVLAAAKDARESLDREPNR